MKTQLNFNYVHIETFKPKVEIFTGLLGKLLQFRELAKLSLLDEK